MKPKFYLFTVVLFFTQICFAQSSNQDAGGCKKPSADYMSVHHQFINNKMEVAANGQQSLLALPATGTDYDVKYYRLELRINPDTSVGKYIKGKVTIYFTTKIANFSVANFDMATTLASDSVYYHGAKLAAGNINRATANLIKITIPNLPVIGTLDSVSIFYKGVPPVEPLFGTGYLQATHGTAPVRNYVYTLSEPYSSCNWWPCKSYIVNDKADSMDMIVSTPLGFRSAGNGTRVYEVTQGSNVITYWKERYPVPAYLICVAVANYVQYPATPTMVNIGGTMMPYYNLIFPETDLANPRISLDRVPLMLTTFSNLFGDYPFKNEKYGNYTFGFGGGMEHTTFSGEGVGEYNAAGDWQVLAHELGHQWWGDNVTCASWQDIWVNESFADYSEILCAEFAPSIAAADGNTGLTIRTAHKNTAMLASNQAQTTYVADTSTIATIFNPSVYIYQRGGMIISMLRTLLGDTKFFQAIKNYQSDPLLNQGNAYTNDVKSHMEAVSGLNLTTFFNNWMYNKGYTVYSGVAGAVCEWNNSGKNIILKLVQKTQSSVLTHFDMPVVVRIQGSVPATMDTTVVIYDQGGTLYYDQNGVLTNAGTGNLINFSLSFTPVTITFDPFSQVMANAVFAPKNTALPVTASTLATNVLNFTGVKQADNNKLLWGVDNSHDYAAFEIEKSADGIAFEKIGTINASDFPNKFDFSYNDYKLSAGPAYYRIKIIQKDGSVVYTKTISIANKAANGAYTITPNPASDYILISSTGSREIADIKIYDATGRVVKELLKQSFVNNTVKITVADLGVGNYFVEIQSANNSRFTKQIVIIK
jgi:aminopeptidase N